MQIPLASFDVAKTSKEGEIEALEDAILALKTEYGIDGISSNFQNQLFKRICNKNGLTMVTPIWNIQLDSYLDELLSQKFHVIFVSVSAMGLGKCWLGNHWIGLH